MRLLAVALKNNTSIETINGLTPVVWAITEAEGRVVVDALLGVDRFRSQWNTVKDLKLPEGLLEAQMRSLAVALKTNTSIETINGGLPYAWAYYRPGEVGAPILAFMEGNDRFCTDEAREVVAWLDAQPKPACIEALRNGATRLDLDGKSIGDTGGAVAR